MTPICIMRTPFKEKFGTPRQPLLVKEALGEMIFPKNDFFTEAFRGISNFSHIWIIFKFHLNDQENSKALIRPPRLGGKEKMGVFATRSPHRPNHLGLSVVKIYSLDMSGEKIKLIVEGVDLVDGTPIFDIKPYLPYVDSIPEAEAKMFEEPPQAKNIKWNCEKPNSYELIEKVIALDPRPSFNRDNKEYGVSIAGFNVRFSFDGEIFLIEKIEKDELSG